MKLKILVPVDFTKTSFSAYHYANQMAAALGGEITLLHVVHGSFSTSDSFFINTLESSQKAAMGQLKYFAKDYPKELGYTFLPVKIKYEVRYGVPGFAITDLAKDLKFDYIIAGTRDNHNVIEKMLGTSSKIMATTTTVPIIFIHENTKFVVPEKIVFAIDNKNDFDESIDAFLNFNNHFKAPTTFVHIQTNNESLESAKNSIIQELFENEKPNFTFEIKEIKGGDIAQSIIDFCIFEKTDMLVLVHRKRGIIKTIFNKSLSLETLDGIHLPILLLSENKPKVK